MDVYEIRRNNLRALAEKAGGPAKFARKLAMTDSYIGQIIGRKPRKNVGPRLARKVEEKLSLEHGWLDQAHAVPTLDQDLLIKAIKLTDNALEYEGLELSSEKRALLYMTVFKRLQAGNLDLGEIRELAQLAA